MICSVLREAGSGHSISTTEDGVSGLETTVIIIPTVHTDRPADISPLVLRQALHTHIVLAEVPQKSVPLAARLALKAHSVSVRGRVGRVPGTAQVEVGGRRW